MSSNTPFFKAFGPLLFGRPERRAFQKLGRMDSLRELYELFGHLLPERLLARTDEHEGRGHISTNNKTLDRSKTSG